MTNPLFWPGMVLRTLLFAPHEFGHYWFRKQYKIPTEAVVIGNRNGNLLYNKGVFEIRKLGEGYGGCVLPLPEEDKGFRNQLPKIQQFRVSLGGPLVDLIWGLLLFSLAKVLPMPLNSVFYIWSLLHISSSFGNIVPVKYKKTILDGYRMYSLFKLRWLTWFLIISFCWIGYLVWLISLINNF